MVSKIRQRTQTLLRFAREFRSRPYDVLVEFTSKVVARFRVQSGPFQGMTFHAADFGKLLGTYEAELAPVIEKLRGRRFRSIVNVGAAEGYYSVGLARLFPQARVISFEAGSIWLDMLVENATANHVETRIEPRGFCQPEDLDAIIASGETLVVIDVEGAELILLDPAAHPALRDCTVLVELHDHLAAGCTETIRERFATTHEIEEIAARARKLEDFPIKILCAPPLLSLPGYEDALLRSMDEARLGQQNWFCMTPKAQVRNATASTSAALA